MLSLALTLLSVVPIADGTLAETCDLIELNHKYFPNGNLEFDQVIFYDWCELDARYNVLAWRIVKHESHLPYPYYGGGPRMYRALFPEGNVNRLIYAPSYRETWTQYDPEVVEREHLPKERRRELRKPK